MAQLCLHIHARVMASTSSSRAAKRRRWQEKGPSDKQLRLSQFSILRCSEASLVKIVALLRKQPQLLEEIELAPLAEAAESFLRHLCRTPVTLPLNNGKEFKWHIADFGLSLSFFAKHSEGFRNMLREKYRDDPCSPDRPWRFILYNDEAVPGAVLRMDNKRKLVCYYLSIRNWGPKILSHEAAWLPIGVLRQSVAKRVRGKFSAVAKYVLRSLLVGTHSIRVSGALVEGVGLDGGAALIFADLGNLIYDEAACNATMSTKGAGGLFPCLCCKNVYNTKAEGEEALSAHDPSGSLVDISCSDPRLFDCRSDDDWWFAADLLSRLQPTLTKAQFEEQERIFGLTWNPDGLLWDVELREHVPPIKVQTYDPAHCLLCHGLMQKEMSLLLVRMKAQGTTWESIRVLMAADWRTCHCLGGGRAASCFTAVFSDAREKHFSKTKEFACGASEMLDIIAPFRYFLEMQVGDFAHKLRAEILSFTSLADVMSLISLAKDGRVVADQIAQGLYRHAVRFAAAYGKEEGAYIPKFHFTRHIPAQVYRDGQLLETLVCERYFKRSTFMRYVRAKARSVETRLL
jgi:hypothetical protein